jgi:energy-coupling factor transporter ATP-binding protein EcfA2
MPASEAPVKGAITMWGPPGSGKTTFLAALGIALIQQHDGGWRLVGQNQESNEALIGHTTTLSQGRRFPHATKIVDRYSWRLTGVGKTLRPRLPFRRELREREIQIDLELVDTPGELASPDALAESEELIDALARSAGIVFFFDPIREAERGDSFNHVVGVVLRLAQRMQVASARLPHRVAVCITKFDELPVFRTAEQLRMIAGGDDPEGLPHVREYDARELFAQLCRVSGSGNAEMIQKVFEQYFVPERIKYFATSAIGFYVDPRIGRFDPADPQNVLPAGAFEGFRESRIRGPVHPINVVEPILWLATSLAESTP